MQDSQSSGPPPASRRRFFFGAATAGAAVATVAALPRIEAPAQAAAPEPRSVPEKGGGYHLSEHVRRYYKSTSA